MSTESGSPTGEGTSELKEHKAALLSLLPNNEGTAAMIDGLLGKKSKYGRPRKNPAFSSYKMYDERDIEFFIRQVSDNDHIYDRNNVLNFDGNIIHQTFDKIETGCQFLSRKNGENAARLWTELSSAYKREKARQENLPSGLYTPEFEPKFPFMPQMWFLDFENVAGGVDVKIHSDQDSNGLNDLAPRGSDISSRKRPWEGSESIGRLDESINRLIDVLDHKTPEKKEKTSKTTIQTTISDLIDHLMKFFETIPKDQHLEYKCKIVMFLESLKPKK